jgi:single-stranded-DNA-specific exonuclease
VQPARYIAAARVATPRAPTGEDLCVTDHAVSARDPVLLARARTELRRTRVLVPHTDADGLSAGAIARRGIPGPVDVVLLGRGQTPFGADAPLPEGRVAVLDWGVREVARPGLLVDHHVPETEPRADQVLVTGHGETPEVSTAALMRRLVPEAPAWLAALGAFGDLGDRGLALPECAGAPRGVVRQLAPLVNAPRRLRDGPIHVAWDLLIDHDDPRELLADPRVDDLRAARDACRAELDRAMRTAPVVSEGLAVLRFRSPCQVHPLVATAWQRRLAPRVVLAANDDYIPGRVNFAVRGGGGDLRAMLREALPDEPGEFAHGHPAATGGSLAPDRFEALLVALGVPAGRDTVRP